VLSPLASLKLLFGDLRALLKPPKLALYLAAGLALQAAYWTLGSPGPQLLGDAPRGLGSALQNVAWALVLLLILPALLMRALGDAPMRAGLARGDLRFSLSLSLGALFVALPVLFVAAASPELQAVYPWAGDWPGRSPLHLLVWLGLYGLYYLAFEFFYRGFMLRTLEPHWGLPAAIWAQTVASTLVHLGKPLPETLGAIPMGLLFALIAVRGRSLVPAVLVHLTIGALTDTFALWHQGQLF
jgi:membrane protease YdiL (CAAX protease family)